MGEVGGGREMGLCKCLGAKVGDHKFGEKYWGW